MSNRKYHRLAHTLYIQFKCRSKVRDSPLHVGSTGCYMTFALGKNPILAFEMLLSFYLHEISRGKTGKCNNHDNDNVNYVLRCIYSSESLYVHAIPLANIPYLSMIVRSIRERNLGYVLFKDFYLRTKGQRTWSSKDQGL